MKGCQPAHSFTGDRRDLFLAPSWSVWDVHWKKTVVHVHLHNFVETWWTPWLVVLSGGNDTIVLPPIGIMWSLCSALVTKPYFISRFMSPRVGWNGILPLLHPMGLLDQKCQQAQLPERYSFTKGVPCQIAKAKGTLLKGGSKWLRFFSCGNKFLWRCVAIKRAKWNPNFCLCIKIWWSTI